MTATPAIDATVVILTHNGERYIRRILEALRVQEIDGVFETLVIDSGSHDATLDIIAEFPEVRLHEIPNTEFGHGKTRNLAAQLANGEFVAYLTHDAVPIGAHWLRDLLAPFAIAPEVAAVLGKQVSRDNAMPTVRFAIDSTFAHLGPDGSVVLSRELPGDDPRDSPLKGFYSDVNSATRKSLLCGPIPYRDIDYAEDQWFGRDVLAAGLIKAYAPRAAVEHSNDLTMRTIGPRIFDETLGLRRAGLLDGSVSVLASTKIVIRSTILETIALLRDTVLPLHSRIGWIIATPLVQCIKERYRRKALHVDLTASATKQHSLEHRTRVKARHEAAMARRRQRDEERAHAAQAKAQARASHHQH